MYAKIRHLVRKPFLHRCRKLKSIGPFVLIKAIPVQIAHKIAILWAYAQTGLLTCCCIILLALPSLLADRRERQVLRFHLQKGQVTSQSIQCLVHSAPHAPKAYCHLPHIFPGSSRDNGRGCCSGPVAASACLIRCYIAGL